ncbi:MAG: lipopolysaccharide biosynthesis protein [Clostridia bacterium]|nr:lipopolysaccharide biosynthesis protein [Clostridia bacterium]
MVNLLFCGNDGVFDGFLTCILSILKRSPSKEPYTFHIFTMELTRMNPKFTPLSEAHRSLLERVAKGYNPENRVVVTDVSALYEKELGHCANEGAYCSPYTLIRLLADLVEGLPDKLLYLDADIMFNRDIHLLYDIDITDYEYAAGRDHYGKYLIQPNYINAGVLLFNMKKMRETGIFARARDQLRLKKLVFADQSALIRSTTRRKVLPQRFNDQKFLHRHTVVRHFSKRLFWTPYPHTENIKQWQVDKVHKRFRYHQFDDILDEYQSILNQTKTD